MAFLLNSRWPNHKQRPNQTTKNRDIVDKANCDVVSEGVSLRHLSYYREAELLIQ